MTLASSFVSPSVTSAPGRRHHPAALVLALGLEVEHAGLLQLLEGRIPELEVQNLALARQKIVFDVEAQHGFKMAAQDSGRDQLGNFGGLVAALLDLVQRGIAQLLARCVLFLGSLARTTAKSAHRGPSSSSQSRSRLARLQFFEQQARTSARDLPSRCRKPTTTSATCTPVLSM